MRRLVFGMLVLFALSTTAFAAARAASVDTGGSERICQATGARLAECCCEPRGDALVCTLTGEEVGGCCCVLFEGEALGQKVPSTAGPESGG